MNGDDEHILNSRWTDLSCYDLADLLFCLNYVGFGLGAGCFFQCHDELKYREFNNFYPLLIGSGKAGIKYLARNYSQSAIAELWIAARTQSSQDLEREQRAAEVIKDLLKTIQNSR